VGVSSNFPPGVTGSEPHLSGQIEHDPHAPFHVEGHPEDGKLWAVYFADDEDLYFTGSGNGWTDQRHAQRFADRLNAAYAFRDPDSSKGGLCRVCNDFHGQPA
jgi:hypothetical protein